MTTTPRCLLCGQPADLCGLFEPDEATSRRIGAPKGKRRCVVYNICSTCLFDRPDAPSAVEGVLIRNLQVN